MVSNITGGNKSHYNCSLESVSISANDSRIV